MLNALVIIYLVLLLLRPNEWVASLKSFALLQLLLLVCVALWAFLQDKRLDLPQFKLTAWFVIAAVLSVGIAGWWGGAIPRLAYLTPIVMLFALVTMVARELTVLRRIMVVMTACACIMVLHGRWQLESGVGWTGLEPLLGRITYAGIFSDPNDLGQLFVICIAFCVYLYQDATGLRKVLIVAAVLWLCYGIYMTDSRGTMLAALAVFGLEGWRRFGKVLVGIAGTMAMAVLAARTRFGEINSQEQSAMDRVESWYEGTQMFIRHPLFGVGMGNYTEHHYLTAHNSIVLPMAELGLFGFVPWIGILWFTGRMLYWLTAVSHVPIDPEQTAPAVVEAERRASLTLLAMTIGFALSSFFLSQSYKHVLFIVVGLVMARFAHAAKIFKDAPSYSVLLEMPKIIATSFGAIMMMWIITRVLL